MRDTGDPPPAPGADTAALAGRIGQLAATTHAGFIPGIARLQQSLQQLLLAIDAKPLLRALQNMHQAVADAQCPHAGPRWLRWVPWLGSGRRLEAQYQADCREALATRAPVAEHALDLARTHQPQAAEAARQLSQLLELLDAMEVPLQQAQSLLVTLWDGMRPQRPDPDDADTVDQLRALLADVDTQRALVQRLEGTCSAASDVVRLGRAVLDARDTLLALLDRRFDRCWDEWRGRLEPVLRDAPASQPDQVAQAARAATSARRALLQQLEQARSACTRLQIDEQALAQAQVHLGRQLAALGDLPTGDEPTLPGRLGPRH